SRNNQPAERGWLPPRPYRLALLGEGRDALTPVQRGGGRPPGGVLDVEPGLERDAPAVPEGPFGRPDRHRGVGGDLRRQLAGGRSIVADRDPPVDQAEPL